MNVGSAPGRATSPNSAKPRKSRKSRVRGNRWFCLGDKFRRGPYFRPRCGLRIGRKCGIRCEKEPYRQATQVDKTAILAYRCAILSSNAMKSGAHLTSILAPRSMVLFCPYFAYFVKKAPRALPRAARNSPTLPGDSRTPRPLRPGAQNRQFSKDFNYKTTIFPSRLLLAACRTATALKIDALEKDFNEQTMIIAFVHQQGCS